MSDSVGPHGTTAAMTTAAGPTVSANSGIAYKFRAAGTCYSGVRFNTDGDEDDKCPTNVWNDGARGQWLDSGSNSDVWVERTINSGSLNDSDAGAGRLNLGTARAFSVSRASTGTHTANVTFDFYDAASGGSLLDTVTIDISAEQGTA
jgi:hypothetical protein